MQPAAAAMSLGGTPYKKSELIQRAKNHDERTLMSREVNNKKGEDEKKDNEK